ncbi:MAG TPA: ribonuclease III domain-containing protein [Chitinophagaceae bacterium]|nr:ribonuclease III domain-containing protein [Chitinophagaceae bacterium]
MKGSSRFRLLRLFSRKTALHKDLRNLLGFEPGNISVYEMALSHRSGKGKTDENNERLEYLGDAILGAIIGDFLFRKYPYRPEGYLTEMRSKIVNRQQLNDIAIKMGFRKLTIYDRYNSFLKVSQIFGNALEALVGAVYLDKGYRRTKLFVLKQIILPFIDLEILEGVEMNYKNKLYGWANKQGKQLEFELLEEQIEGGRRLFTVGAAINGKVLCSGKAYNKKDASQIAAQRAIEKLGIVEKPELPSGPV